MSTTTPVYEYRTNGGTWRENAPNDHLKFILDSTPLKSITLDLERGDEVEWRIRPVPYYVNMGRWSQNVIGPFDTFNEADAYIDRLNWKGSRPTVVQIARPEK